MFNTPPPSKGRVIKADNCCFFASDAAERLQSKLMYMKSQLLAWIYVPIKW